VRLLKLGPCLVHPPNLFFEGPDLNQELFFLALLILHAALLRVLIGQALG
jgi:hypothetical protein